MLGKYSINGCQLMANKDKMFTSISLTEYPWLKSCEFEANLIRLLSELIF